MTGHSTLNLHFSAQVDGPHITIQRSLSGHCYGEDARHMHKSQGTTVYEIPPKLSQIPIVKMLSPANFIIRFLQSVIIFSSDFLLKETRFLFYAVAQLFCTYDWNWSVSFSEVLSLPVSISSGSGLTHSLPPSPSLSYWPHSAACLQKHVWGCTWTKDKSMVWLSLGTFICVCVCVCAVVTCRQG